MFIVNVSNHPSHMWTQEQRNACKNLPILDIPFPYIDCTYGKPEVEKIADRLMKKILTSVEEKLGRPYPKNNTIAVHIMGEYSLTYHMVVRLKQHKFITIASTTRRETTEKEGKKKREFKFVRFREY